MSSVTSWVFAIAIALCILGLMAYGRAERQDYWAAKTARIQHAQVTPQPTPAYPPGFLKR